MPRITEELLRKRAEHNNGEITTLEELSLHQQDLDKIEHLDRWCRHLKILYLQNNLIARIENVSRLKDLQYLNLALNNLERIENLEGCEFLEKLDFTVNFIGELTSIESLRGNVHLKELYLTGNPCTEFEGYRDYVVATLPQLERLDGKEITKSEKILSLQKLELARKSIVEQQKEHAVKRVREKEEFEMRKKQKQEKESAKKKTVPGNNPGFDGRWYTDPNAHLKMEERQDVKRPTKQESHNGGDKQTNMEEAASREKDGAKETESDDDEFWNDDTAPFTPESRTETLQYIAEKKKEKAKEPDNKLDPPKRVRRLERDGQMLNINEGRHTFHLEDDEENSCFKLEVECPRFMDTSLIDCDVQPTYVRITIKGKILQLVLGEEVSPDKSSVKRSQTTGHLVITMPKTSSEVVGRRKIKGYQSDGLSKRAEVKEKVSGRVHDPQRNGSEEKEGGKNTPNSSNVLEVDPSVLRRKADIANIVPTIETDTRTRNISSTAHGQIDTPTNSAHGQLKDTFIDDPEVPPLI